jgi:hypothetical protein
VIVEVQGQQHAERRMWRRLSGARQSAATARVVPPAGWQITVSRGAADRARISLHRAADRRSRARGDVFRDQPPVALGFVD